MATIKGNKLLPVFVGLLILIGIVIAVVSNKKAKQTALEAEEMAVVADLSEEDLALLGVDGDTEKDTVQTLVTLVKSVRKKQAETDTQIKQLKSENEQLKRGNNANLGYKITPPKSNEQSELEKQVSSLTEQLTSLTTKYANIGSKASENSQHPSTSSTTNDLPIGQTHSLTSKD